MHTAPSNSSRYDAKTNPAASWARGRRRADVQLSATTAGTSDNPHTVVGLREGDSPVVAATVYDDELVPRALWGERLELA